MRLLRNEKTMDYHEIEVEYSFLWIKWKVKYRKVGASVFRFKSPNNYYRTSNYKYITVADLFKVSL